MSGGKLFLGTSYSPEKVYATGFKQALEVLRANGAEFNGDKIRVALRPISELPLERDAPSKGEVLSKYIPVKFSGSAVVEFEGCGAVLYPSPEFLKAFKAFSDAQKQKGFAGEIEVVLDGKRFVLQSSLPKNIGMNATLSLLNAALKMGSINLN